MAKRFLIQVSSLLLLILKHKIWNRPSKCKGSTALSHYPLESEWWGGIYALEWDSDLSSTPVGPPTHCMMVLGNTRAPFDVQTENLPRYRQLPVPNHSVWVVEMFRSEVKKFAPHLRPSLNLFSVWRLGTLSLPQLQQECITYFYRSLHLKISLFGAN